MKSDDKTARSDSKPEDRPLPGRSAEERAALPPLRDSMAGNQAQEEERARDPADDKLEPDEAKKLTPRQQQEQDQKEAFARERERMEEIRKDAEAVEKQAEGGAEMKLFIVRAADPQAAPFHFSNTPGDMVIAAPSPEYARRLARNEAGHDAWADEDQVSVEEWQADSPMVITRDFKG